MPDNAGLRIAGYCRISVDDELDRDNAVSYTHLARIKSLPALEHRGGAGELVLQERLRVKCPFAEKSAHALVERRLVEVQECREALALRLWRRVELKRPLGFHERQHFPFASARSASWVISDS